MNTDDKDNVRTPSGRKPKTFSAWQEIRRKQPHIYYQGSTYRRVIEDRETLGRDAFYARPDKDEEL